MSALRGFLIVSGYFRLRNRKRARIKLLQNILPVKTMDTRIKRARGCI